MVIRRASTFNTSKIDHIYSELHDKGTRLFLHHGDLTDSEQVTGIIYNIEPDEVYHLGAQSHVRVSFDTPTYSGDVTVLGTTRLLKADVMCFRHRKEIERGELGFLDKCLEY